MNIHLPIGGETIPVDVPDNWINGRCYRSFRFDVAGDVRAELLASLQGPVGVPELSDLADGKRSCCVVVDSVFPGLFPELLPALLEAIEDATALRSGDISVLLTNFFWKPLGPEALPRLVPEYVRNTYRVELHDPNSPKAVQRGTISGNVPLFVNPLYAKAELKVLLGAVCPHLLYGFTGGRSLILPGIAHSATNKHLYAYENVGRDSVRYGSIRDNPFHMAALEAVDRVGADMVVSAMMTPDGQVAAVNVGDAGQSFIQTVAAVRDRMTVSVKEPMDIVVTSGGGDPHDRSLVQLLSVLTAIKPIIKTGGTIVLAASLADGFGPDPLRDIIVNSGNMRSFRDRYSVEANFRPGQWIAQRLFDFLSKHEVIIRTDGIAEDDLWKAGLTPSNDLQEAIEVAMQGHGQRCKICALPDGPFSLAHLGDRHPSTTG